MPVPSVRADTARTLLRDQAYARLRDAILDGTLEPGEQLKDAELAEWLGLSRTPIREAVARLEQYGLVETEPNRYTRVAPLSARDARDAFPVVAALEALAASLGVPQLAGADLETMAAANREIVRSLERLMPKIRRLERARFGSLAGRRSVEQHERIIALCAAGEAERAAEAVRENWLTLGALIDQSFGEET